MSDIKDSLILEIYNLLLSIVFIITGVLMIQPKYGIFLTYPDEWVRALPFNSWFWPGVIMIAVFGIGNLLASCFSFIAKMKRCWVISAVMAGLLFLSLISQVIILKEIYMATIEFFILAVIQLLIVIMAIYKRTKR